MSDFKTISIKLILKPGRDCSTISSYRPISLLPCVTKVFERLIKSRLQWYLEHFNLIPDTQYGFRRGFGTMDAASRLITDIQINFSKNKYCVCLFLDLVGAYDCVDLDILLKKMQKLNLSRRVSAGIVELFRDRQVFIKDDAGQLHGPRLANQGLPQGSALSPILFNIYTMDLHELGDDSISIIQYADDICLYSVQDTFEEAITALDHSMQCLNNWLRDNNFSLSAEKSAVVVFTRHRKQHIDNLSLAGHTFPVVRKYKYLGLILDDKLLWSHHVLHIKKKCERGLNMLKFVTRRSAGASPKIALTFYRAYIRSIIDYGCVLYGSASKSNLLILDRLQYKALRISLGCMRSSPIHAILSESNEWPLKFRRVYLACKFFVKLQYFVKEDLLDKICFLTTESLTNRYWFKKSNLMLVDAFLESKEFKYSDKKHLPFYLDYETMMFVPNVIFPDFKVDFHYNVQLARCVLSDFQNCTHIFTDGSKTSNNVGGAYYIPERNISHVFRLNTTCTVYTAEAYAIKSALEWSLQSASSDVLICSDSMSVLSSIRGDCFYRNPLIAEIRSKIVQLRHRNIKTILVWVKGHSGIEHNETADHLAKVVSPTTGELYHIDSPSDVITSFRQRIQTKWLAEYSAFTKTSNNPYFLIHPELARRQEYIDLSRKFSITVTRLKMNHGTFPAHLNKIGLKDSPFCACDNTTIGDLNHIFFSCPLNDANRHTLMNYLASRFQKPMNITSILSSNKLDILKALFYFVAQSNVSI